MVAGVGFVPSLYAARGRVRTRRAVEARPDVPWSEYAPRLHGRIKDLDMWNGLLQSLEHERISGYEDYLGDKGRLSEFAASLLMMAPTIEDPESMSATKYERMKVRLTHEFTRYYGKAGNNERRQIIRDAAFLADAGRSAAMNEIECRKCHALDLSWLEVPYEVLAAHRRYQALDLKEMEMDCHPSQLKQRSLEWHMARKNCMFTASSVWKALGFGEKLAAKELDMSAKCTRHSVAVNFFREARQEKVPPDVDDIGQLRMEWGNRHEDRVKLLLLENNPFLHIRETGLHTLDRSRAESALGVDLQGLPEVAASPDGLLWFYDHETSDISGLQVCEIKCRFPFAWSRKGWSLSNFIQAERKPQAMHYAQIQMQMLCSNTRAAQFISHSVNGSRIFAIERNDDWLRLALLYLSEANKRYIQRSEEPEKNFFYAEDEYRKYD